jgi:1-phosphofructokinase
MGVQRVVVLAPAPLLTVTIETIDPGDDIHVHAGGQGVWVAQMVSVLEVPVTLCGAFAGETGTVARLLLERRGLTVRAIESGTRGSAYVHDRRAGERHVVAEMQPELLSRHDVDELYGAMLAEGMNASVSVLTGSTPNVLPVDVFRRLTTDLRHNGRIVVADLSGEPLAAALDGGVTVLKVSDAELVDAGWAKTDDEAALERAMHEIHENGAEHVIVSRAEKPALLLTDQEVFEIHAPPLEALDHRGAGDSMTAGTAAGLARGLSITEAVQLGAAAGSVNVTRHGLASGDRATIQAMVEHVEVKAGKRADEPATAVATPESLAARVEPQS